ncbi:MAG: bifunctional phosphoribosylaminoimidazolecarboxamide formyltransferase/IMP cyclohydrolase [Phycisphaerae bacterium]
MAGCNIQRALISVYDKTGIVDFARALVDEFHIEIISTGGTAALLKAHGIAVTLVEDVTGFPELMDGRVKTLHPRIHAAILADRDNPEHMRQLAEQGIKPIDMVVVNLYPFAETVAKADCTFEQAIEMIDIGGPCLLRAAAKNHKHVLPVTSAEYYCSVLEMLRGTFPMSSETYRVSNAFRVFERAFAYDAEVASWLDRMMHAGNQYVGYLRYLDRGPIRYGENPHQSARMWQLNPGAEPTDIAVADQVGGEDAQKDFSFNNYVDADAALGLCRELVRAQFLSGVDSRWVDDTGATSLAVCVFIKHTNACGAAFALSADPASGPMNSSRIEAYRKAYLGDPHAAMGGILACNFEVTEPFAEVVMETFARWGKNVGAGGFFVEVWIAPSFDERAVKTIRTRKKWGQRVRLMDVRHMGVPLDQARRDYKKIAGGMLVQDRDLVGLNEDQWKVDTERQPTEMEMADLRLAWLICKHTKSNAISICKDGMLIGNGAGQMSRVMSCRIATWLAKENGHADKLPGAVAASDAFFPFRDGPDLLIDAGVTAIIQPGGARRDADTIDACNERDVAMIFTGTRHFKH